MEDKEMNNLWKRAREVYLRLTTSEADRSLAERHFSNVEDLRTDGDTLVVSLNSEQTKSIFENKMSDRLLDALRLAGAPESFSLKYVVAEPKHITIAPPKAPPLHSQFQDSAAAAEEPLGLSLKPEYVFSEFVEGMSNRWALNTAKGISKDPGNKAYNPFFIHGGTGLGKTHLMQAIGNELKANRPDLKICYINAEAFMNEYMNALQKHTLDNFRQRYRTLDVLLMDDVQFMASKNNLQEEFFNTFYTLQNNGKQIVMTSDVAPKNLPALEPRLMSRFEGGIVQSIEAPQFETRLAILKKKAESFASLIPEMALVFIAENIRSQVRAMEGALNKIKVLAENDPNFKDNISNTVLNIILKDQIDKEKKIKAITCQDIIDTVCSHFNITLEQIQSSERTQELVLPRQMAMFISYNFTQLGYKQLEMHFKKTHATILSGVKKFKNHLDTEPQIVEKLNEVINKLGFSMKDMRD